VWNALSEGSLITAFTSNKNKDAKTTVYGVKSASIMQCNAIYRERKKREKTPLVKKYIQEVK